MTRAGRADPYADFVPHPRYGRRPRITALDPVPDEWGHVFLHWHSPVESRVPNTAIAADLSRQSRATVAVTHYFDAKRQCRDCRRPFLFFAEEQKRERYAELLHVSDRTIEQNLELVDCCLALVEAGVFSERPWSAFGPF